jgi:hypothetical protein
MVGSPDCDSFGTWQHSPLKLAIFSPEAEMIVAFGALYRFRLFLLYGVAQALPPAVFARLTIWSL